MSVVADSDREFEVPVGTAARAFVLGALDVLDAMARDEIALGTGDRAVLDARLDALDTLRRQLDANTSGEIRLVGPESLIASVVRAAVSQAAYELDALVEELAGKSAPADDDELIDLRHRIAAASGVVGAFVACESGRRAN